MEQHVEWQEIEKEQGKDDGLVNDGFYEDFLKNEITHERGEAETYLHLGILAWEAHNDEKSAFASLQLAEELDPRDARVHYWLARIYYESGADREAKSALIRALQIKPRCPETLALLGEVKGGLGEGWHAALLSLEKALLLAPDWPMIWLSVGLAYLRMGDLAMAQDHFKMVEELASSSNKECRNAVEKYFEKNVTGRACPHMIERMDYWKYRIARSY